RAPPPGIRCASGSHFVELSMVVVLLGLRANQSYQGEHMGSTVNIKIVESLSEQQAMVQQRIRERAYERYLNRGDGSDQQLDDWLAAEGELTLLFTMAAGKT